MSASRLTLRLVAGLTLMLSVCLHADVPGLYDARVAVDSQSDSEQAQGTRDGLSRVLVRLTGLPDVAEQADVRELLQRADRYVQQFGYSTESDDGDDDAEQLYLSIRFDGQALLRDLAERDVPVWVEADRPRVLVWLAVDRSGDRALVGGETELGIQQTMRQHAADDGLPILFPLQDLEDQQRVTSSDIWGGFRDPVLRASERYRADVVLVGRVERRGEGFGARWLLLRDGDVQDWADTGDSLDSVLATGTRGSAERLARDLARRPGERVVGDYTLRIDDVSSLESFGFIRRLLVDTSGVNSVDVIRADARSLYVRVQLEGDSERLIRDLERTGRLERIRAGEGDETPDDTAPNVDLAFRLRG